MVTVGAVDRAENRIEATAEVETILNVRGGHGHPVTGLMAGAAVRPLVPRLWKNGFVRSMSPVVLNVFKVPASLGKFAPFGSEGPLAVAGRRQAEAAR